MASGSGRGRGRGSGTNNSGERTQDYYGTIQPDLFVRQPGEPKIGSSGRPQRCFANFVPIEMEKADYSIYQFHVEFDPVVDSKHVRERMLLHENVTDEIGCYHVFDGMILYLTKEWHQNVSLKLHIQLKLINFFSARNRSSTSEHWRLDQSYFQANEPFLVGQCSNHQHLQHHRSSLLRRDAVGSARSSLLQLERCS